ncbi:MAG: hypothetical protein FWE25_09155 [Lachnospiraceae bacterium]|nr:hypothetical protein [Lachnospiraceae bacterium]
MNRFSNTKKDKSFIYRLILPLLLFVAIVLIFLNSLGGLQEQNVQQQQEALHNALNKSIIHSYATYGFYPPSLNFIKERYQLNFNENLFYVDYQPLGANIIPDVTIIVLNN